MIRARPVVAHTILLLALVGAGCSESHGRDGEDAGAPFARDAGPAIDAAAAHDAGHPGPDSGLLLDAGVRSDCDPQDARGAICPDALCDGPPRWHWNGDQCFWVDCGACEGTDCAQSWSSEAECAAAHAACEPQLCRGSGGTWMWWAEECEHYVCGLPQPATCILGRPVCDCGPNRGFDPSAGCVAADCAEPPPTTREIQCTSTGGSWSPICCDTQCGELCPLACAAMACDCGVGRNFEEGRGCVESARCHERLRGESCAGAARCEEGTICCDRCGGAGCSGRPTCADPTCDADPHTDTCGNRDDVP